MGDCEGTEGLVEFENPRFYEWSYGRPGRSSRPLGIRGEGECLEVPKD